MIRIARPHNTGADLAAVYDGTCIELWPSNGDPLKAEVNRGPVVPVPTGKTRITIRLDDDILAWFREQVHAAGGGNYQTLINQTLRRVLEQGSEPLETVMRRVV
jgi:uncharacterized protein (DUF4415 family)